MKRIFAIIMVLMMAVSAIGLTACGSAQTKEAKMAYSTNEMPAAQEYAEEVSMDYAAGAYDVGYAAGAYDMGSAVAEESAVGFSDAAGSTTVTNPNRKLIKEVNLEVESKEYDSMTASITAKVKTYGGYVENSSSTSPSVSGDYTYNQSRHMNLTARIPAENLDDFVAGVSAEGNVTYKSENVTDITLQYTDTASRKKSLLEEQQRLNELMKKAETVEDLIAIEARLSEVRYQLESIESQLRTYDNQVDYSTVYIGISEVVDYTPQTEATFGEKISEGFSSCIHGLGVFFENLLVFLIAFSPALLLIAAVVVVIVLIVKNHKKKKQKKAADQEAASNQKAAPEEKDVKTGACADSAEKEQ